MTLTQGTFFFTDDDIIKKCTICDSICDKKKGNFSTSYAMAMAKKKRLCYKHTCPYVDNPNHKEIVLVREDYQKVRSKKLKNIIQKEIDELKIKFYQNL